MIDVPAFVKTILELGADGTALEGVSIRVGRLEPADEPPVGLLETAGAIHDETLPAYLPFRVSMTWYAATPWGADQLYGAATDLLHRAGPLVIDGIGLWRAFDETGPSPRDDANTNWSATFGVVALYMPDVALT